jgi:hypothetical protein
MNKHINKNKEQPKKTSMKLVAQIFQKGNGFIISNEMPPVQMSNVLHLLIQALIRQDERQINEAKQNAKIVNPNTGKLISSGMLN